ncbi:MAG: hypothetical protein R3F34_04625 [Planctomycetota bacterium]
MGSTPKLPRWVREPEVPGYASAHRLLPDEPRLYGTESLFGDWSGQVLLLSTMFAPAAHVRARLRAGDPRPYAHDPNWPSHRLLLELARPIEWNGLLHGAALANLLREGGRRTAGRPHTHEALEHGVAVTRFTVEHMPNLEWIVCLGELAWNVAARAVGVEGRWSRFRDAGRTLGPLVPAFNTSARVPRDRIDDAWRTVLAVAA